MSKLKRFRSLGLDELRVRGAQAVTAAAERQGWSTLARLPDDASFLRLLNKLPAGRSGVGLLAEFRTRTGPKFFSAFADPHATVTTLREALPNADTEIIDKADRIVSGRFDLLGFRDLDFDDPID